MSSNKCTGVYIVGHFYNYGGYANMAHQYAHACKKRGIPYRLYVTGGIKEEVKKEWIKEVEESQNNNLGNNPFLIIVDIPPRFRLVNFKNVKKVIGSTIFETNSIPTDWVAYCNLVDEIWVPSDFNLETFSKAGVSASILRKLPLAIDVEFWSNTQQSNNNSDKKSVELLCCGSLHRRKGFDKLIEAYFQEFSKEKDSISLTFSCFPIESGGLKSANVFDNESLYEYLNTLGHRLCPDKIKDELPEIKVHYKYWNESEFRDLFRKADGYISTERANGWALPVMQMMSIGKPVCCIDWGGSTEYVNDTNAVLIKPGNLIAVDPLLSNLNTWYRGQYWPELETQNIRNALRHLYEDIMMQNQDKVKRAKEMVHSYYSYQTLGQNLAKLLNFEKDQESFASNSSIGIREHPYVGNYLHMIIARIRKITCDENQELSNIYLFSDNQEEISLLKNIIQSQGLNYQVISDRDKLNKILCSFAGLTVIVSASYEGFKNLNNTNHLVFYYDRDNMNLVPSQNLNNNSLNRIALFFSGGITKNVSKLLVAKGIEKCDAYTSMDKTQIPTSLKSFNFIQHSTTQKQYDTIYICDEDPYLIRISYQGAESVFSDSNIKYITYDGLTSNLQPVTDKEIFKRSLPKRWLHANNEALEKVITIPCISNEKELALLSLRMKYFLGRVPGLSIYITVSDDLLGVNLNAVINKYAEIFYPIYGELIDNDYSDICLIPDTDTFSYLMEYNAATIIWDIACLTKYDRVMLNRTQNLLLMDINHSSMRSGFSSAYAHYFALSRASIAKMRKESREKLNYIINKNQASNRQKVTIFGTGPSLSQAFDFDFTDSINIVCNTIVKDINLINHINPVAIVASDADFHFGPSVYAQMFRNDLVRAIKKLKCYFICPEAHLPLFLALHPEVSEYCIGIPVEGLTPSFDLNKDFRVKAVDNVLLQFLLPLGSTFGNEVNLIGFDGRKKEDTKFWQHNINTQYTDLMNSIEHSHPAFFFFRNYINYFDRHCSLISNYLEIMEGNDKKIVSLTDSSVPALKDRSSLEKIE